MYTHLNKTKYYDKMTKIKADRKGLWKDKNAVD